MKDTINGWFEKQIKNMRKKPYFYISSAIVIFLLIAYFCSFVQPGVYGKGPIDRFFVTVRFLFVNEHNRLNWVSISAIGVMVSYAINSKFNRDKLRADLVSSARIEWLQNTRQICSDYLSGINMVYTKHRDSTHLMIEMYNPKLNEENKIMMEDKIRDYSSEFNELIMKVDEKYFLYSLQFGIDRENNALLIEALEVKDIMNKLSELKNNIEFLIRNRQEDSVEVYERISNYFIENESLIKSEFEKAMNKFTESNRLYLKNEWDKAKEGR